MDKLGVEFRIIIAYLVPGLVFLYAAAFFSPTVKALLGVSGVPQSGAILPILVLSIGLGIVVNAVTWATLRHLFEWTGRKRPDLDYSNITADNFAAFESVRDENYRYYQSYSNMLTSGLLLLVSYWVGSASYNPWVSGFGLAMLIVLGMAARDALIRTYDNMESILSKTTGDNGMTNGVPVPPPIPPRPESPEEANKPKPNGDTEKAS